MAAALFQPKSILMLQRGACIPVVPKQLFSQYMDEVASVRYEALRLNKALNDSRTSIANARSLLAPTGHALNGLARQVRCPVEDARHNVVEGLFKPFDVETECIVRHFAMQDVLTVRTSRPSPCT